MRVLFASWAWPSHYQPLAPLGWAFRAAGHEVCVASQPALTDVVTSSGLPAVPVGADLDYEELMRGPMAGVSTPAATAQWWKPLVASKPAEAMDTFVTLAESMLDDLVEFARWWRPDLVVHDTTTFAAPIAAALVGATAVRHTWGPDLMARFPGVAEGLAPLFTRYGVAGLDVTGVTTVDPCPRSMQVDSPLPRTWLRFAPYNGPAVLPSWLLEPKRGLRVAVTCGTTSGKLGGERRSLAMDVIEALGDLDGDIVLAISPRERAGLGRLPDRTRVVELLPLHLLMPSCDLLVHRGGGCTIMTALAADVPQLIIPELPDHAFNARQFAKTGAGRVIYGGAEDRDELRSALDDLIGDPSYRAAAARLRVEMAGQPPADQVVAELERLALAS